MNNIKLERINSSIQKEISYILSNEVKNPNVKFITITAVDTFLGTLLGISNLSYKNEQYKG